MEDPTQIHASAFQEMTFEGEYAKIPQHMRDSIMKYVIHRIKPGRFLSSVICDELRNAVCNADAENLPLIKTYVLWFFNHCPSCVVGKDNFYRHLESRNNAANLAGGDE